MNGYEITSDKGQTMAEYAVVLAVITASIVATFALLAGKVEAALKRILELVGGIA